MTDNEQAAEGRNTPPEGQNGPQKPVDGKTDAEATGEPEALESPPEPESDDQGEPSNTEAAKYRIRARKAEAERDTLAARIELLQRVEVNRQAEAGGLRPDALWASGADLGDLLADNGTVDASKVHAAMNTARERFGLPDPRQGNHVPDEGRPLPQEGRRSGVDGMVDVVMGRDQA